MANMSSYLTFLHEELPPINTHHNGFLVLDLFAGCGGLALGFEEAGFKTVGFEMLGDAVATYNQNLQGECHCIVLEPGQDLVSHADVIVGGPPCQPFSVGGYQHGRHDRRDGFPAFLSAVERYQPKVALFENVRGMLYRNKAYFNEILYALIGLGYKVEWKMLNAIHYGVPQKRERLFVVAHKGTWQFPKLTVPQPFTSGDALGELASSIPPNAKFLTPSMDDYIARYEAKSKCINPRDLHLDKPSRTVTCRNLSAPTGDMLRIRLQDGRRRRLTVREGARLQSFPDWFECVGKEESQFNQIGNAVPPLLAKALALSVLECLASESRPLSHNQARSGLEFQPAFDF